MAGPHTAKKQIMSNAYKENGYLIEGFEPEQADSKASSFPCDRDHVLPRLSHRTPNCGRPHV